MSRRELALVVFALSTAGCAASVWYPWAHPVLPGPPVVVPTPSPGPTPSSTPLPTPTPTPSPVPTPTPTPTPGSECPPLVAIKVGWIANTVTGTILDATPLTDRDHCHGIFEGRTFCPLGVENTPKRITCEAKRIGGAGPVWIKECFDGGSTDCVVVQLNPYLAKVRGNGPFKACSQVEPICGSFP